MSLHFDVEVDDEGRAKIKKIGKELEKVGDKADKAGKKGKKSLNKMAKAAGRASKKIAMVATKFGAVAAAAAIAAAAAATAGLGLMVKQGIQMNAELEAIETQFKVIYGDAKRAAQAMKELVAFSASTPFQLGELAESAKTLEAFGIGGSKFLRMVGDASAAAQRPIQEVAMTFGRIKSGAYGEAFMRLAEMGLVTREMLEMEGLEFNRGGSYLGTAEEAIEAVSRVINSRFAGMMEELSQTWKGKVSTMIDNWKLFTAALTKPIFDVLKPRLDQLTAIFQRWREDGTALWIGSKLAVYIDKAAGAIVGFISNLPHAIKWIMRLGKTVALAYEAIKAAFDRGKNIVAAFTNVVMSKVGVMIADINIKWNTLFGEEASRGDKIGLAMARTFASAAQYGLDAALQSPGLRQTWEDGMAEILKWFEDPDTNIGIGVKVEGEGEGGPGLDAAAGEYDERFIREQQLLFDIKTLHERSQEEMGLMYSDYWRSMGRVAKDGFADVIVAEILESGSNIKMILNDIWQSMKRSFVQMTVDMALSWIISRAKMAIAEASLRKAAAADQAAMAGVQITAAKGITSATAGQAAAGYHAAHAYIPFGGAAIAQAFIAKMMADIGMASAGALALREGGFVGLVPGGASAGVEDNYNANLSGGEYVLPRNAVDSLGVRFLDSLRTGVISESSAGGILNLSIENSGGTMALDEEEVEELLSPLLERLGGRRRISLARG